MPYLIGDPPRLWLAHVPKTGGNWARKMLDDAGIPLAVYGAFGDEHHETAIPPDDVGPILYGAFVRHPVTWLASFWADMENSGWRYHSTAMVYTLNACAADAPEYGTRQERWDAFLAHYLEVMPGAISVIMDRYLWRCHLVGNQETLVEDWRRMLQHSGLPVPEFDLATRPRVRATGGKPTVTGAQAMAICEAEADWMGRHSYSIDDLEWATCPD